MLSTNIPAVPAHPLTKWVPGEGFVGYGWLSLEEQFTISSVKAFEDGEQINVLAYVAKGTPDELSERLERVYAYLAERPELHLVDVVEDIDGRRLRQVARIARGHVNAVVTTIDSFDGPEHLRMAEEILEYYGIKLIVIGFYGF